MTSVIFSGLDAYFSLRSGFTDLARAAARSMGPCGRSALIEHVGKLAPNVVKDGAAICRALKYREHGKNAGLKLLVQAAKEVEDGIGDGVSATIVVTATVINEVWRALALGLEPEPIMEGLSLGAEEALLQLRALTRPVVTADLEPFLLNVVSQDAVAELISQAYAAVGNDGDVRAEIGNTVEDQLDIVHGARYDKGFASPAFATDKAALRAEFREPLILLSDASLDDFEAIVPALSVAAERSRPLVVIAAGFEEKVRAGLIMNNARGRVRCAAGFAPAQGDTRSDFVGDLAALTGARPFLEAQGDALSAFRAKDLGECERLVMDQGTTHIAGGRGSEEAKKKRMEQVRAQMAFESVGTRSFTGKMGLREKAEDRIRLLQEKCAEISIGGRNDINIKYRLALANKAIAAARSFLRGGAIPGGGAGLAAVSFRLRELARAQADMGVRAGLRALATGLAAPREAIFRNAGGELAQEALREPDRVQPWRGMNAANGSMTDLWQAGIADPAELAEQIIDIATGIAKVMSRSAALIVKKTPDIGFSPEEAAATREVL